MSVLLRPGHKSLRFTLPSLILVSTIILGGCSVIGDKVHHPSAAQVYLRSFENFRQEDSVVINRVEIWKRSGICPGSKSVRSILFINKQSLRFIYDDKTANGFEAIYVGKTLYIQPFGALMPWENLPSIPKMRWAKISDVRHQKMTAVYPLIWDINERFRRPVITGKNLEWVGTVNLGGKKYDEIMGEEISSGLRSNFTEYIDSNYPYLPFKLVVRPAGSCSMSDSTFYNSWGAVPDIATPTTFTDL